MTGEVDDEQRPLPGRACGDDARLGRGERLPDGRGRHPLQQHDSFGSEVAQLAKRASEPLGVFLGEPEPRAPEGALVVAHHHREARRRSRRTGQGEHDARGEHGGEALHGRFSTSSEACREPFGSPERAGPLRTSAAVCTASRTHCTTLSYVTGSGVHTP